MKTVVRIVTLALGLVWLSIGLALAQPAPPPGAQPGPPPGAQPAPVPYSSSNEVLDTGNRFFGSVSRGLAQLVERASNQFGQPNGYILGQEGGGALTRVGATSSARESSSACTPTTRPIGGCTRRASSACCRSRAGAS